MDITYKVEKDQPYIQIYGKTVGNEQICVVDSSFKPYFYVLLREEEDLPEFTAKVTKIEIEDNERIAKVTDAEIIEKKFLGKTRKAVKVYTQIPADIAIIRDVLKNWEMIESINEFDIHFTRRYLIDKGITPLTLVEAEGDTISAKNKVPCLKANRIEQFSSDSIKEPKILAFDIETYNPTGKAYLPEKNPIIMLAFYGKNFKKVITWKRFKTDEDYIEFVDGEVELIERFKKIIENQKPDILAGYFSDGFDLPYIITRAKKYDIDLDINLDKSKLTFRKGATQAIQLTGIVHFDVFKFVSKIMSRGLDTDSYSLDNVAAEVLGERKVEVDLDELAPAWDNNKDLEKFCIYNLKDADLTYRLAIEILPNIEEMVKIVGLPLYDINRMSFSQLDEWYILKQAKDFNELAPNRPHHEELMQRREKRYQGAFVYEPTPGLYKDLVIFDFRSLYPTIISSHNIGPSTLNCSCCKEKAEKVPGKEFWYCKNNKSFLSSIVGDLITRRMRIKEMLKKKKDVALNARSESLKVLANSFYGYLGFFGARWYCFECAESVTAYGRHYIHKVIDLAKEKGFEVIYSDTDSIFLKLGEQTKEDALKLVDKINSELPGIMELEYEGFYPSGIFVQAKGEEAGAKKKYALLGENNELKITGFETVRRNWSFIAKEVQKEVLNIVLKEDNPEKAVKYVKKIILDLKEKKIPNKKLIIITKLQREIDDYASIGPHVAIAQRMKNRGDEVGPGSLISYIITAGKGVLRDRARIPDELEEGGYDADYYINNQILPSVERIFEVLGYKKEEFLAADQSRLGEFF